MHPQTTFETQQTQESSWKEFPESQQGEGSKAQELKEGIRRAGAETARRAREQGEAFLGEQKHTASESLHHVGEALKGAADQLRGKKDQNLASFAETIAERLERTSGYLEGKQIQDIRDDLEGFARRQPQVFYGTMFVAGLALSRFFKASQSSRKDSDYEQGKPEFAPESSVSPENAANPI